MADSFAIHLNAITDIIHRAKMSLQGSGSASGASESHGVSPNNTQTTNNGASPNDNINDTDSNNNGASPKNETKIDKGKGKQTEEQALAAQTPDMMALAEMFEDDPELAQAMMQTHNSNMAFAHFGAQFGQRVAELNTVNEDLITINDNLNFVGQKIDSNTELLNQQTHKQAQGLQAMSDNMARMTTMNTAYSQTVDQQAATLRRQQAELAAAQAQIASLTLSASQSQPTPSQPLVTPLPGASPNVNTTPSGATPNIPNPSGASPNIPNPTGASPNVTPLPGTLPNVNTTSRGVTPNTTTPLGATPNNTLTSQHANPQPPSYAQMMTRQGLPGPTISMNAGGYGYRNSSSKIASARQEFRRETVPHHLNVGHETAFGDHGLEAFFCKPCMTPGAAHTCPNAKKIFVERILLKKPGKEGGHDLFHMTSHVNKRENEDIFFEMVDKWPDIEARRQEHVSRVVNGGWLALRTANDARRESMGHPIPGFVIHKTNTQWEVQQRAMPAARNRGGPSARDQQRASTVYTQQTQVDDRGHLHDYKNQFEGRYGPGSF